MTSTKSRDEIAKAYDSPPWWYDVRGFFILTFAYNSTLGSQMKLFGRNFGDKHIEIACGSGTFLRLLLQWRSWKKLPKVNIVGIDYAEAMLAGAIHIFKDDPKVELHHADAAQLPFSEGEFDTANIANSIHCFPDVDGALKDISRVLKPGGVLAANVLLYPRTIWPFNRIAQRINDWGIKKGILYTPYEKDDIRERILAAGFVLKEEQVSGNCYNILCVKKEDSQ